MRSLLLLAFLVLALPAAAQDAADVNPNRCAVQTTTAAPDPGVLEVALTREGKVYVGDAAMGVGGVEEAVARHLARAPDATVALRTEPGTPHRLAAGVLDAIKAGYADARTPPRVAVLEPER